MTDEATGKVWAVVGATGFVGRALVRQLELRGRQVIRVQAPRVTVQGNRTVDSLHADLARSDDIVAMLGRALDGASIVVNAAGLATPSASDSNALFGANSLLPAIIARAARSAAAARFVHLSSAAVQGNVPVLDNSYTLRPFSPYSASKCLGEQLLLHEGENCATLQIIRATSVQGIGRQTTRNLQKIACSPLATVARPGSRPSAVSSIDGLVNFVIETAVDDQDQGVVFLQPWEGATTAEVLYWAGGRKYPRELPAWSCRAFLSFSRVVSTLMGGRFAGAIRRIETMWFGQQQFNQRMYAPDSISDGLRAALLPVSLAHESDNRGGKRDDAPPAATSPN